MDKENVVYIQNIIQPQEEGSLAICHNMDDLEDTMLSEISQIRQIFYDLIFMWNKKNLKLIETENRLVNAKGMCVYVCVCVCVCGWGRMVINGCRVVKG